MADIVKTRMKAEEYLAFPETNQIVELIDGEVIMPPAPTDDHQRGLGRLFLFVIQTVSGGEVRFSPVDVYLDDLNVVQPDLFWVSPQNDQCILVDGKYWRGAPDFVIEILSPSTAKHDKDSKFKLYEKYGVREYWLVNVREKSIDVFVLEGGRLVKQGYYQSGETFQSAVLNGAAVDVKALLDS